MTRSRRAFVLPALAAAVVAIAAGCGGSGNSTAGPASSSSGFSAYELKMQALGVQLGATLARIGLSNVGVPPKVIAKHLEVAQLQLRNAAAKLAAIKAPDKIKADQALLLKGVREYADGLSSLIAQLRAPARDNLAYLSILHEIDTLKGVKEMQSASLAITKAGYLIALK